MQEERGQFLKAEGQGELELYIVFGTWQDGVLTNS